MLQLAVLCQIIAYYTKAGKIKASFCYMGQPNSWTTSLLHWLQGFEGRKGNEYKNEIKTALDINSMICSFHLEFGIFFFLIYDFTCPVFQTFAPEDFPISFGGNFCID